MHQLFNSKMDVSGGLLGKGFGKWPGNRWLFFLMCLPVLSLLIFACGQEKPLIVEVDFDQVEFADFVEPDFPYITTSIDARDLGKRFPTDNISARALAVKVGETAYMAFDPDMLRWTVGWTGDFLPMVTMAQISYNSFYDKNNKIPTIGGYPHFATGQYPGWVKGDEPMFLDPRPANPYPGAPSWGALDAKDARWEGHYLQQDGIVLSYTVGETSILERPGSFQQDGVMVFTRSFEINPHQEAMHVAVAEVKDGIRAELKGHTARLYHGDSTELVTAVSLVGDLTGVKVQVKDNRYLYVTFPGSSDKTRKLGLGIYTVESSDVAIDDFLSGFDWSVPEVEKGFAPRWKERVLTQGQLAPDTAAFVTDRLTLPVPNPWNRNVRVVDLDFFEKDKAALVTFEGDVWVLEGISKNLNRLSWRRFASGLYEPQSISVVDGQVYVYGKEGIVRLHDLNEDGEADFYENFSNIMAQSIETREWASDMVKDPAGGFYIAKFGALDMGPETSSPKAIMGFRAGSQHGGAVFKVSADGREMEMVASGFRGPYLGIDPKTGRLSGSDQQGHHMPSTPIMLIEPGDYYGVAATAHRTDLPEITPPLTWIPHAEDRSGVSQLWVHSDRMGPLNGKMIHFSYGRPGLFQVLVDEAEGVRQGAVSVIKGDYPAPTMKAEINPGDGWVYLGGFALWGHKSEVLTALLRLRYTGLESTLPEKFQARDGGVMIRFGMELDEASAKNIANYSVKRWNYQRSGKYGSGHFKLNGEDGEEQLPVVAVEISTDKRAVFLAIPRMANVMQMEVDYRVKGKGGTELDDSIWFTVNELAMPNLLAEGFNEVDFNQIFQGGDFALATIREEAKPTLEHGKQLYAKMNCIACHSIDGNNEGRIGPGMKGIFGKERPIKNGEAVLANEDYLAESILEPSKKIVEGYDEGMPSFLGILSENDIASLILFIKSL